MKNLIIKTIVVCALSAFAVSSFAQEAGPRGGAKGGPGGQAGGMMRMGRGMQEMQEKVLTKIGATAEQKDKLKAMGEKMMKARREFMQKELGMKAPAPGAGGPGQRPQLSEEQRGKMMDFSRKQMTASQAEIKKILGDKFAAYEKEMRAEFEKMRGQMGGGRGGQKPGGKKPAGNKPPQG